MRPAAALLLCLFTSLSAFPAAGQDSLITVRVAAGPPETQARLTRAMMAEGLAIEGTSTSLVVATGTEKKNTIDVRYTGVLLPAGSGTEVTLSAIATAKARMMGANIESRVTSNLKGGKDVWARMQRMADAVAANPSTSGKGE